MEVTESTLMTDLEGWAGLLAALRGLGVRATLDDFGAGYSSLARLAQLPLDLLKVDRGLVRGAAPGSPWARVLEAVAALGRTLGLRVVAEGVETEAELALVRRAGCTEAQRFWFSPPVPGAEALARWGRGGFPAGEER